MSRISDAHNKDQRVSAKSAACSLVFLLLNSGSTVEEILVGLASRLTLGATILAFVIA